MGNRAIIIPRIPTEGVPVAGIYVHWNGGAESVLAFLEVCKRRGYRDTECDPMYAMGRLCGVIHEFFGIENATSLGICVITDTEWEDVLGEDKYIYDNGIYVIGKDWTITERRGGFCGEEKSVEELNASDHKKYEAIVNHIMSGKLTHDDDEEVEE